MLNEILLLKGNPSKRRKARKGRTAAQRAATRRMLAANRSRFLRNPSKAPKSKKRKTRKSASSAPRRKSRRVSRMPGHSSNLVSMLKQGAFMGGGAIVADVGMGLIGKFMPTMPQLTSRVNADGSINYTYFAAKGALIYAMGKYGSRVTRHANTMAAGALGVMAYELLRTMMPTDGSIPLGYFNPGRIVSGGNLGRIMRNQAGVPGQQSGALNGIGRIMALPAGQGKGAVASATIRNLNTNLSGLARR